MTSKKFQAETDMYWVPEHNFLDEVIGDMKFYDYSSSGSASSNSSSLL